MAPRERGRGRRSVWTRGMDCQTRPGRAKERLVGRGASPAASYRRCSSQFGPAVAVGAIPLGTPASTGTLRSHLGPQAARREDLRGIREPWKRTREECQGRWQGRGVAGNLVLSSLAVLGKVHRARRRELRPKDSASSLLSALLEEFSGWSSPK